jgi:hypothetical protein
MKDLKFGALGLNTLHPTIPMPVTAAQVIKDRSGRFVTLTTNTGAVSISGAADTMLDGFIDTAETASSASGLIAPMIPAAGCRERFRIPIITGTLTALMFGKTCDIAVSSNVQGANLTASSTDVLLIVGGDIAGQTYVDVMINPNKATYALGVV